MAKRPALPRQIPSPMLPPAPPRARPMPSRPTNRPQRPPPALPRGGGHQPRRGA